MNFLLGSFAAASSLLEMDTSSAFYTFISARARGPRLFVLYGGWLGLQFIVVLVVVGLLTPEAGYQMMVLGLLLGLGAGIKWTVLFFAGLIGDASAAWTIGSAVLLYVVGSLAIAWRTPGLAGLQRDQLRLAVATPRATA